MPKVGTERESGTIYYVKKQGDALISGTFPVEATEKRIYPPESKRRDWRSIFYASYLPMEDRSQAQRYYGSIWYGYDKEAVLDAVIDFHDKRQESAQVAAERATIEAAQVRRAVKDLR